MYEDPFFAVRTRQELLRADADRRRLTALVRCCRESLRRRVAQRLAQLRPAPGTACATC